MPSNRQPISSRHALSPSAHNLRLCAAESGATNGLGRMVVRCAAVVCFTDIGLGCKDVELRAKARPDDDAGRGIRGWLRNWI